MKNEIGPPEEIIRSKIYLIRGQKIMLDRDLAELYEVQTRVLKQAVRRNLKRFPEDFMFELSKEEMNNLRSQIVTSSWGGVWYAPMAFTEQGVAMLSSVLNSPKAIDINIQIIRVFTKMRELLSNTLILKQEIEEIKKELSNQGKDIELVFQYLDEFIKHKENTKSRTQIGFKK